MADQPLPPLPPSPIPPAPPRPPTPLPKPPSAPAAPTPPATIPVKSSDVSHLSPSPATFSPSTPPRSTVRTMESDLASKAPTRPMAPSPLAAPRPVSTPPSSVPTPPTSSPPPAPRPSIQIPDDDDDNDEPSGNRKKWLVLGGLVFVALVVVALWYALSSKSDTTPEATKTPSTTPTPTRTPTPKPLGFVDIFTPEATALEYQSKNNSRLALTELTTSITKRQIGLGDLKTYTVLQTGISTPVTGIQFGTDMNLQFPANLTPAFDPTSPLYMMLFGKTNGSVGRTIAIRLVDQQKALLALSAWEPTMPSVFKDLFGFTPSRASNKFFLDNTYQNVKIRFQNYPDAYTTIDYAVIETPAAEHYLIATNSRENMFKIIDRLMGVVPGK